MPFLSEIDDDADESVVAASLYCLVELLEGCGGECGQRCLDLLSPFDRIISRALDQPERGSYCLTSPLDSLPMRPLSFIMFHLLFSQGAATSSSLVSAVEGLLRLFAAKMSPPPSLPSLAIRIFEMLLAQLHTHIIAMKTKMEKPSSQSGQLKLNPL